MLEYLGCVGDESQFIADLHDDAIRSDRFEFDEKQQRAATWIIICVYILMPLIVCLGCGTCIAAYLTNCFKNWGDHRVDQGIDRSEMYEIDESVRAEYGISE